MNANNTEDVKDLFLDFDNEWTKYLKEYFSNMIDETKNPKTLSIHLFLCLTKKERAYELFQKLSQFIAETIQNNDAFFQLPTALQRKIRKFLHLCESLNVKRDKAYSENKLILDLKKEVLLDEPFENFKKCDNYLRSKNKLLEISNNIKLLRDLSQNA